MVRGCRVRQTSAFNSTTTINVGCTKFKNKRGGYFASMTGAMFVQRSKAEERESLWSGIAWASEDGCC